MVAGKHVPINPSERVMLRIVVVKCRDSRTEIWECGCFWLGFCGLERPKRKISAQILELQRDCVDGVEPTIETGKPRPRTPWYVIEQGSSIDDRKCCFDDDLAGSLDSVMLIIFTIWAETAS